MSNDRKVHANVKPLQSYFPGVFQYLKDIPCIRQEMVDRLRRELASGVWHPGSKKVAEKILSEHLFSSREFGPPSPSESVR